MSSDLERTHGCPACDAGVLGGPCATCDDTGLVTRAQRDDFHEARRRGTTRDLVDRYRRAWPALGAVTLATLDARVTALEALHKHYEPEPQVKPEPAKPPVTVLLPKSYRGHRVHVDSLSLSAVERLLEGHDVTIALRKAGRSTVAVDGVLLESTVDHDLTGLVTLALYHLGRLS